ncbi:hypothetical protein HJFPF1_05586 [Paramyrothecium foliicola]|nr:hypothetical protein HJFPF1_05586 [Paramyrothecium foliicola]
MKFLAASALALASVAAALPGPSHGVPKCKPGTYRCAYANGAPSWDTCDVNGVWVVSRPSSLGGIHLREQLANMVSVLRQLPSPHRLQVLRAQRQPLLRPPQVPVPMSGLPLSLST